MRSVITRGRLTGVVAAAASVSLLGVTTIGASAEPTPDELPATQGLRKAVTVSGMQEHLAAFQQIADENGGSRVSGFPAFNESVDYVEGRLTAAGYDVTVQPFDFPFNADRTPPVFNQTAPSQATYQDGTDFASMTYSGNGDVTAAITAVDLVVPPVGVDNGNTSGCEAADFAGFPAGNIALDAARHLPVPRQGRTTPQAAGAAAVIIFNEGQPGRTAAARRHAQQPGVQPSRSSAPPSRSVTTCATASPTVRPGRRPGCASTGSTRRARPTT